MGKTCAFLGNNYDKFLDIELGHRTPAGLKARIREEVINLIENEDVDTFLVGEIGGYEVDAYDVVLDVQKEYPHKAISYEPMQTLAAQGVQGIASENIQSGYMNFCEPKIMLKKQEVALKNATSLQSGWSELAILELKFDCF